MRKGTKFTAREIFLLLCAIGVGCLMGYAIVVIHHDRISPKPPSFVAALASLVAGADNDTTATISKILELEFISTKVELPENDGSKLVNFVLLVPKEFTKCKRVISPFTEHRGSKAFILIPATIEKE